MILDIIGVLLAFSGGVTCGYVIAKMQVVPREALTPEQVHEAMQSAPHDGRPFRQARAAISAIRGDDE